MARAGVARTALGDRAASGVPRVRRGPDGSSRSGRACGGGPPGAADAPAAGGEARPGGASHAAEGRARAFSRGRRPAAASAAAAGTGTPAGPAAEGAPGGPPDLAGAPAGAARPPAAGLTVGQLLRRPQMWGFIVTTACIEFCRGALFIALLPAYLPQRLGLSVAGVGLVISTQYLADTVFKIPSGWLVDRFGPWRALLPSVCLAALAVYLLPHARGLVPLVLLALLFGLGTSANWPAVLTGSVHISGLRSRASASSIPFLAWLAGGGIGPVLISFLVGRENYVLPFVVLAVVISGAPLAALLGLTGALASPLDPPWSRRLRDEDPAETFEGLVINLRRVVWLLPGMFVQMLALGILVPVLVPFARQVLHLTQAQYGLMLLAGGAVTVFLLVPMGRVVDRIGSKGPLVAGFFLAALAVLLVVHGSAESDLLWRVALLGFSYAVILPAWNGLTVGKIAEGRRGLLLGVFMAIEGVGITLGPVIGGALYVRGYHLPFEATAAVLAAIGTFYLLVPGRSFAPRAEDGLAR